jgi:ubiquitin C-terminal hydrolase
MVILKRFVFHEMNSIKLDDRVEFLVERLDMTPYLASHGEEQDQQEEVDPSQNIYSLQSYVCHTGGANSGHYTAFAKHCVSDEWLFFNDSNVTLQEPKNNDERGYILFYQRVGSKSNLDSALLANLPIAKASTIEEVD